PPCSEQGVDTLPANGLGTEQTDTVPTAATSATEQVEPATPQDIKDFDSLWPTIVQVNPKLDHLTSVPLRRFVTCHVFAQTAGAIAPYVGQTPVDDPEATYNGAYLMAMTLCLQLVAAMQHTEAMSGNHPLADAASSRCNQVAVRLPIMVSRVGSKYTAQINATGTIARGRSPLI